VQGETCRGSGAYRVRVLSEVRGASRQGSAILREGARRGAWRAHKRIPLGLRERAHGSRADRGDRGEFVQNGRVRRDLVRPARGSRGKLASEQLDKRVPRLRGVGLARSVRMVGAGLEDIPIKRGVGKNSRGGGRRGCGTQIARRIPVLVVMRAVLLVGETGLAVDRARPRVGVAQKDAPLATGVGRGVEHGEVGGARPAVNVNDRSRNKQALREDNRGRGGENQGENQNH
jgi:hypothetical protein